MPGVSFQSREAGVTQPAINVASDRRLVDGREPESLPDVRSTDARSAGIGRPDGVRRTFQVSRYSVEPSEAVLARNLFSKHD
jgi:hypothetical protein